MRVGCPKERGCFYVVAAEDVITGFLNVFIVILNGALYSWREQ
jgi:hypothetical protein